MLGSERVHDADALLPTHLAAGYHILAAGQVLVASGVGQGGPERHESRAHAVQEPGSVTTPPQHSGQSPPAACKVDPAGHIFL